MMYLRIVANRGILTLNYININAYINKICVHIYICMYVLYIYIYMCVCVCVYIHVEYLFIIALFLNDEFLN